MTAGGRAGERPTAAEQRDPLALVDALWDLTLQMPRRTVAAELATFGPVLNAVVGGREGVGAFRDGVLLDEAAYIDLYREVYQALLADMPAGSALLGMVDLAIEQDHRENDHLLSAFAMLDPEDGGRPEALAATRHAAPAAAHAAAKFALLLVPSALAVGRYVTVRARARD